MNQQIKLRLGILELKKVYSVLEDLNFSDDTLKTIWNLIDDLEELKEGSNND